jgi:hypothetical protein
MWNQPDLVVVLAPRSAVKATAFARCLWASFVHVELAPIHVSAIEATNCFVSVAIVRHFDETEAFAAASLAITDYFCRVNDASLREQLMKIAIGRTVREIAYIKFLAHGSPNKIRGRFFGFGFNG